MVYVGRMYASWDDYNDSNLVDCCSLSKINIEKDKRTNIQKYTITNTISDNRINNRSDKIIDTRSDNLMNTRSDNLMNTISDNLMNTRSDKIINTTSLKTYTGLNSKKIYPNIKKLNLENNNVNVINYGCSNRRSKNDFEKCRYKNKRKD
jgi:ribosomal protein L14E/L6E/L27E